MELDIGIVSSRLRSLRKKHSLTMQQMGEKLGLGHTYISRWESGLNMPSLENVYKICIIFGVTGGYMLGLEDEDGQFISSF